MDYIVGIDFGHGETAAWVVPMPNVQTELETKGGDSLRLKNANNHQDRTLWSEVFQYADGTFKLYQGTNVRLYSRLKAKISKLRTDNDRLVAYKEYIRLVIGELLALNGDLLRWNPDTQTSNFLLCMANPTRWNKEERTEYLNYFNAALYDDDFNRDNLRLRGLKFEWIINESDAAFFSQRFNPKNMNGTVLVIDYGSSTIDYTLMRNGLKVSDDEWSNQQLGASAIERAIHQALYDQNPSNYDRILNEARRLSVETGNGLIDLRAWLDHQCREAKEYSYKGNSDNCLVVFNVKRILGDPRFKPYRLEADNMSLSSIIASYVNAVKRDFESLKQKMEQTGYAQVDRIILSGGAYIMQWVSRLVKEIFPESRVIEDRAPSFVVAKGIALYAQAQQEALEELENVIKKKDFGQLYKEADVYATREAIKDSSPAIVNEIKNSEKDLTGDEIRTRFCEFIKSLNEENRDYCALVQSNVNAKVAGNVQKIVHDAIKKVFSIEVSTSDIKIDVKVNFYRFADGFFEPQGVWYEKFTKWIPKHCRTWLSFDWAAMRNKEKRVKIADGISALLCSQEETAFLETLSYNDLDTLGDQIRQQALSAARQLFYEEQIFKTTFCEK